MAELKFIFKKTTDLTARDKDQLRALFLDVFGKNKSPTHFDSEFLATPRGYSYHALLIHGDLIVGCYSSIPYRYSFFGVECLFALSVDTMIKREFRGMETLLTLANLVYDELRRDGVEFVFGFPNDNIYQIRKRFFGWKDLGTLDYFVLPVRLGAFVKWGGGLDFLSRALASVLNSAGALLAFGSAPQTYGINLVDDQLFRQHRHAFFDGGYHTEDIGHGGTVTYRIDFHHEAKVAYLVNVTGLSRRNFFAAARRVFARHHADVDALVYVGKLRFLPVNLLRLPKRFEPKKVHMSGKILAGRIIDERVYDLAHWKVNLASFDVV